jgi:aspartyl/asparaginyl beta-hydroxylase (cupin superfamily)
MCSIEPIRHSSHSKNTKYSNRTISLKLIEKRLNHLREELRNLTRKEIQNNHEQNDHNDDHYVQYKKRLDQLLRLYEKQVCQKFFENEAFVDTLSDYRIFLSFRLG